MTNFKQLATRSIGRTGLVLKKYSPEILTGVGIATGVAAGVLAIRATLKVEPVIDGIRENLEGVERLEKESNVTTQALNNIKGRVYGEESSSLPSSTGLPLLSAWHPSPVSSVLTAS